MTEHDGRRLYNYSWIGAYQSGFGGLHSVEHILQHAPDATDFEIVGIADCTMFKAAKIINPPSYIVDVTGGWPK